MTLNELRTNLILMGWIQVFIDPPNWERWDKGEGHVLLKLDPEDNQYMEVGRFARDGTSPASVNTYEGLAQLAEDMDDDPQ